jgi:hypothetical protein
MGGTYDIFEKLPDGKLMRVETVEGLDLAKMRFSFLTFSSQREYLVYDPVRGCEVVLRAEANAG